MEKSLKNTVTPAATNRVAATYGAVLLKLCMFWLALLRILNGLRCRQELLEFFTIDTN
jgi:hypothetical protein